MEVSKSTRNSCMHEHIGLALRSLDGSFKKPIPRRFDDLKGLGSAPYDSKNAVTFLARNHHMGQRKLCVAMVEFLTFAHLRQLKQTGSTRPLLVVYAGCSLLAALSGRSIFRRDLFMCLDPSWKMTVPVVQRETGANLAEHIEVLRHAPVQTIADCLRGKGIVYLTEGAGKFTDASCAKVNALHSHFPGYDVAFVSDVRTVKKGCTSDKEVTIASDMVDQARWVVKLQPSFCSLKLRLPFLVTPEIRGVYARLGQARPDHVRYIDGMLVLQKYARNESTEMRLFATPPFKFVTYDVRDVESHFSPFNIVHRGHTLFDHPVNGHDIPVPSAAITRIYAKAIATCMGSLVTYDESGEAEVLREAASVLFADNSSVPIDRVFARISSTFNGLFRAGPSI